MKFRIDRNEERDCWDVMWSGSTSRAARFETLHDAEQWVIEHDDEAAS